MSFFGSVLGGLGSIVPFFGPVIQGFASGLQEQDQRNWIQSQNDRNLAQQFQYNSSLQQMAQAFNAREAEKARNWNSLPEQMKRAAQAGINPLAALGANGQSQIAASGSASSVGLPSVGSVPNGLVDLVGLANAFAATKQGEKIEKETSRYDEQLDALISKLVQDASTSKAEEDSKKLFNDITRIYGKQRASLECIKLLTDAYKSAADGNKAEADKKVSEALERLHRLQGDAQESALPFIKQRAQAEVDLLLEQGETERHKQSELDASAGAHRAAAEVSRQTAKQIKELTPYQVSQAKEALKLAKMGNTEKAIEVVDKALGIDTGAGAYLKVLFTNGDLSGNRWNSVLEVLDGSSFSPAEEKFIEDNLMSVHDDDGNTIIIPKHKKRK